MYRSGFAAIIGRPNVGKSTIMNVFIGQKTAITSDKPQTTRNRIRGILTLETAQVIFIDTPGIHKPKHKLGEYMVRMALSTLNEVDLILFVADISTDPGRGDKYILDLLKRVKTPVFLVLNKVDLLSASKSDERRDCYKDLLSFNSFYLISALENKNLDSLQREIIAFLPEGPQYYPADSVTDQPERFIAAELIREKALRLLREELPFAIAVEIEEIKARAAGDLVSIRAVIYIERDSQKGIVVGKGGQMLKKIGSLARIDLEALFGSKVFLDLWVKVKKDWRNKESALRNFGYQKE